MALATDESGIQFRILNSSKGPAVRATRAQADRILYKAAVRRMLENQPNLWIFQQACDDLMLASDGLGERVVGAITQSGIRFPAKAVILTAGTFLDGRIHIGLQNYQAGRAGDPPAISLAVRLKELQLPQGRLMRVSYGEDDPRPDAAADRGEETRGAECGLAWFRRLSSLRWRRRSRRRIRRAAPCRRSTGCRNRWPPRSRRRRAW